MAIKEALKAELQHEARATREMLKRVPESELDSKPHEKSMSLGQLASHVAQTPKWITMIVNNDEYDFIKDGYNEGTAKTNDELLKFFDDTLNEALDALENTTDENLMKNWKLKAGEKVYVDLPKVAALRAMAYSHFIHHRGQLSVYLRLKDVPLPSVYGPTADEQVG